MVRERIEEVVEFATGESPYRNANKGWINKDVFIQWGAIPNQAQKEGDELLDVFVFWGPIKRFLTILFAVVLFASFFVFTAVSFSQDKLRFSLKPASISLEGIRVQDTKEFDINKDQDELKIASEIVPLESEVENKNAKSLNISNSSQLEVSQDSVLLEEDVRPKTPLNQKKNVGSAGNLF